MTRGQRFALVALAVALAAAAFVALRPEDGGSERQTTERAPAADGRGDRAEPAPRQAAPEAVRIRLARGRPAGGVREVEVEKGDTVRLVVTADAPAEIHVHGYEIFESVAPRRAARLRFEARLEGVFEIELEGSHTPIAELRVEP